MMVLSPQEKFGPDTNMLNGSLRFSRALLELALSCTANFFGLTLVIGITIAGEVITIIKG